MLKKATWIAFTDSRYLQTKTAALDSVRGKYEVELELKRKPGVRLPPMLEPGTLLEVHFQHPDPTQPPMVVEHVVKRGETLIRVQSPDLPGVTFDAKSWYAFAVFIYSDESKTTKLGVHHQLLLDHKSLLRSSRGTYSV